VIFYTGHSKRRREKKKRRAEYKLNLIFCFWGGKSAVRKGKKRRGETSHGKNNFI